MRIYEFVHSSAEHDEWYDNLRKNGDVVHLLKNEDYQIKFNVWIICLSNIETLFNSKKLYHVDEWLLENNITYPFTNKYDEILFRMRFE